MKKTICLFSLILIAKFGFSQAKVYQAPNGKLLSDDTYQKAKVSSLERMGSTYEIDEVLTLLKTTKDSIIYAFKWDFLTSEMRLERKIEKGLIGRKLELEYLKFLVTDDRGKIDRRKPTLVNFWFTSCPPCIEELPALEELRAKFAEKINFLAVTFDTKDKVQQFLKDHKFDFTHIVDEHNFIKSLGFSGYPKTFLLNKDGVLVSIEGALPSKSNDTIYTQRMKYMTEELNKLL
ncbi:MAG: TlpA family protein disulfide reductase [Pedobacter sp.]|nr:MAG: TlpA family protein disulfide reductase [Pedobacter sp.]